VLYNRLHHNMKLVETNIILCIMYVLLLLLLLLFSQRCTYFKQSYNYIFIIVTLHIQIYIFVYFMN